MTSMTTMKKFLTLSAHHAVIFTHLKRKTNYIPKMLVKVLTKFISIRQIKKNNFTFFHSRHEKQPKISLD